MPYTLRGEERERGAREARRCFEARRYAAEGERRDDEGREGGADTRRGVERGERREGDEDHREQRQRDAAEHAPRGGRARREQAREPDEARVVGEQRRRDEQVPGHAAEGAPRLAHAVDRAREHEERSDEPADVLVEERTHLGLPARGPVRRLEVRRGVVRRGVEGGKRVERSVRGRRGLEERGGRVAGVLCVVAVVVLDDVRDGRGERFGCCGRRRFGGRGGVGGEVARERRRELARELRRHEARARPRGEERAHAVAGEQVAEAREVLVVGLDERALTDVAHLERRRPKRSAGQAQHHRRSPHARAEGGTVCRGCTPAATVHARAATVR
jgi:hypothetical protein